MMDGSTLYPKGFLAPSPTFDRTGFYPVRPLWRSGVPSFKYYVIDFGISTLFEDRTISPLVTGAFAQDDDVPELSETVPYSPFLVDVFTLGNVFKNVFLEVYSCFPYDSAWLS